ncbi:MAG: hypothetical protein ACREHG_10260 [Candidatus Saccharimonadales bacterium]
MPKSTTKSNTTPTPADDVNEIASLYSAVETVSDDAWEVNGNRGRKEKVASKEVMTMLGNAYENENTLQLSCKSAEVCAAVKRELRHAALYMARHGITDKALSVRFQENVNDDKSVTLRIRVSEKRSYNTVTTS